MDFQSFFTSATGYSPFPWQMQLAETPALPDIIHIPTGLGKTAVIVVWLWKKWMAPPDIRRMTPRRLVYCLPMRTLVRQTEQSAAGWIHRLTERGLLPHNIPVTILMGGESTGLAGRTWDAAPEQSQILIGTQDQLISRALNRGYAMSRYRWPAHFALLNNDALWIMDEVQLMGTALTTSAQLDGFRHRFTPFGPTHTIWMSATMNTESLHTIDHPPDRITGTLSFNFADPPDDSPVSRRITAPKPLVSSTITLNRESKPKYGALLTSILLHDARPAPGETTLVI
ncbi:DEAD/DEAH box helicase, partial [bacterium]|nr:DEAD/DEAH box helicase [candidate division CSSED10-310 bacterium]